MKIVQISTEVSGGTTEAIQRKVSPDRVAVYGLGEDSVMYKWDYSLARWDLFSSKKTLGENHDVFPK